MIVLIGPLGALVPECAEEISRRTGWDCAGVEAAIEALNGSPSEIVERQGAAALQALEIAYAHAFLEDSCGCDTRVLALGSASAGSAMSDDAGAPVRTELARLRAEGAEIIHLTGDLATLSKRTGLDGPRFASVTAPRTILYTQLVGRTHLYNAVATRTLDTSGRVCSDVVNDILREVPPTT